MFKGMRNWQKGALYSIFFVLAVSVIYAGIMVFFEYRLEDKGELHVCGEGLCSLDKAISERIGIIPRMIFFFGIPLSFFAMLAGLLIDRYLPKD